MTTGPPKLPPKSLAICGRLGDGSKGKGVESGILGVPEPGAMEIVRAALRGGGHVAGILKLRRTSYALHLDFGNVSAEGKALWRGELPVTLVMEIPSTLNCDCDCRPP